MVTVQEKLSNPDFIIEDAKTQPQTYNTILKEEVYNATYQFVLRRKVNKLCKEGRILKAIIPGTRFGQALIYVEPRQYKILVEALRTGIAVYYFFEYERVGKFYLKLSKFWLLDGTHWQEKNEEKTLFEGNVLKFI